MQINLIPKTREQEQKKLQVNSLIFLISVIILGVVGATTFVLYSINLARKSEIKKLEEKITSNKNEAENYNIVKEKANFIITGMGGMESLINERKDWTILYNELQNLMPRESYLYDFSMGTEEGESNKVVFEVRTRSVSKVAELIESLRVYEMEIPENINQQGSRIVDLTTLTLDNLSEKQEEETGDNNESKEEEVKTRKIRLFSKIEVSEYSKQAVAEGVVYTFKVEAFYVEDLWTKKK